MSQTLTLPDELIDILRLAADQRGVSIEQLIDEAVRALEPGDAGSPVGVEDEHLLLSATRALLDGTEPPIAIDWDELKQSLLSSEPAYGTIEETMGAVRQRPWSKDD